MPIMPILVKTTSAIAGTMLAGTVLLYSGGVVEVCVKEKGREQTHIHLPLPALAGAIAVHFIPSREFRHPDQNLRQLLPAIRIASQELERCPDGTVLVEVRDARETVHITKEGGDLVIDVDNPHETVHVSFPIRMAVTISDQLADQMDRARPSI
jgi:hypothetical protein